MTSFQNLHPNISSPCKGFEKTLFWPKLDSREKSIHLTVIVEWKPYLSKTTTTQKMDCIKKHGVVQVD